MPPEYIRIHQSMNGTRFTHTYTYVLKALLHFTRGVGEAKCILVTDVCVSVCLSLAAFPHYCTNTDVSWGRVGGAL